MQKIGFFIRKIAPVLYLWMKLLFPRENYILSKAKGRKGSIVAIIKGTQSETVIEQLLKIGRKLRKITLDMAGSMKLIAKSCFPDAIKVIDSFHVQKLAIEALQELRINYRWEAIELENRLLD